MNNTYVCVRGGEGGGGGGMARNSEYVCIPVLRSCGASAGQAAMVWLVRPRSYRFLREKKWHHLDFNLRVD